MFAGFAPVGVNDKLFYKMTWGPTHLISISKGLPSHCRRRWSAKDDCSREGSYGATTTAKRDVVPSSGWEPLPACACPLDPALLPPFFCSEQSPGLSCQAEKHEGHHRWSLLLQTQLFPTCGTGTALSRERRQLLCGHNCALEKASVCK